MKTILIVDDLFENLYLLKVILEQAGYKVIEANDGKEALGKLHKTKVSLIISDILMPVMDGYMFCQACKKDEAFKNIPFIFYTSTYIEKTDEDFALKLGATYFLRKPTNPDKIIQVVKKILDEDEAPKKPQEKEMYSEHEVLKLYSNRLITKLEQKKIDLEKEIFERKKVEQKLINENAILDLIANNTPIKKVFNHIIENYEALKPAFFASISLLNHEGTHLNLIAAPRLPKAYNSAVEHLQIGLNIGSCGTAAFIKKPVIVSDISTDKLWKDYKELALQHNLKSCWSIPILSEENSVLGTFAIYSKTIKAPSLEDIKELTSAVSLAKMAIVKFNIIAEVKKKDEAYRSLINQANDAILTFTFDGVIYDFNKATHEILGFTKEEFSTLKLQDIIVGDIIESTELHNRILSGESVVFERQFICKNKSLVDIEISAKIQKDGKVLSIGRNVTERKKAEIKLLESEYNLRQSQIVANIGSYTVDLKNRTWESSDILDKILGIDHSFVKTIESWIDLIHPNEKEEVLNYFDSCICNNKRFNKEYRVLKFDTKEEIWTHGVGELFFDDDGIPIKMIGTMQNITNQKNIEINLLQREFELRQSQIVANIGSYSLDLNTGIWDSSEVLDNIFGINENFLKDVENWISLIHPDDRELMKNHLENDVIKNHEKFNKEYRLLNLKNKKEIWVHGIGELIYDSTGNPIKMIGTIQDITLRKRAEVKLLESEYNLRQSQKIANIGSFSFDVDTKTWKCSEILDNIYGFKSDTIKTVDTWVDIIHPEDKKEVLDHYKTNVLEQKKKFNKEYRIIRNNDHKVLWVHGFGELIEDSEGNPLKVIGTTQDINDRKLAELKLQENERSLLVAQKIAKIGSFNLDLKKQKTRTSNTFNQIIGLDPKVEVTVDVWKNIVHPEDKVFIKETVLESIKLKKQFSLEYRVIVKNKSREQLKWIHGIGDVIFENGEAISFYGTIQDITERKKTELELKVANEFTDNLVMSMQEGLLTVDLEGTILKVNDSLCKILGYSEQELIGMELPYPFAKAEDYENMLKIKDEVAKGNAPSFKLEFVRKDGSTFIASFLTGLIKNDNGVVIAIFATIKDVSEEEKVKMALQEVALKSAQKKDVILKLAGLVGVDYKNALKTITKEASKTLNVARVSIWSFNADKTELHCEHLYDVRYKSHLEGFVLRKVDNPDYFEALSKYKSLRITDALTNKITAKFAENYLIPNHIESLLDVFVNSTNGSYGILCFEHVGEPRAWDANEQEFATSIASTVSLMIESRERKIAENRTILTNKKLTEVNKELNTLKKQLEQENVYLRHELDLVFNYEEMVYGSEAFSNVLNEVEKVATTNATVLLLGESGTGKELLARAIHNTSLRNKKPLIKVNCSAIPRELLESELFGHKKGSFSGAVTNKIGKFELADGGTLFLDEIGELPLDMQPKILRFLQEGEIEVVGGLASKKLDVRVIAATNRNLKEEIEKKQFREDLFFRLNVFPIIVPPLRKRKDDIPLLVEHFVDKFNKAYDKKIKYIPEDAMNQLKDYHWPGNIRELENLIERALILSESTTLLIPGFETTSQKTKQLSNSKDSSLNAIQRNHILQVLEECNWKISGPKGASVVLDIKPSTLRDKMNKLGILKPIKK
ncbi:sigma 54-interacting transcriptional regulator [Ulvibacter litoralis]|uniref:PAS domain S-box-containing protein n=1 Tax=Ulvibacter litoralis TaxID=227084 RepID=A0A1G7HPK0_9FLAO|nr:sigma 54-interacting transcriptional regulator [Ulvibacter litoralis]GHC58597.1 hypothetical protein GCM10008083_24260 [Ulvibacter litoralis]SDF02373.1 PAS domain S-box-containing protein [Ulvibacter litoralis]